MDLHLSTVALFAAGAFLGALFGRIITFGVMSVVLLFMLVLK